MKTKIFGIISIVIIILIAIVWYSLISKENIFKESLLLIENTQLSVFQKEKIERIYKLNEYNKGVLDVFIDTFNEEKAIEEKDTMFSFLFWNKIYYYKTYNLDYLNCLQEKSISIFNNKIELSKINYRKQQLENRFNEIFTNWYTEYEDRILLTRKVSGNCSKYFVDYYNVKYEEKLWDEFEQFLNHYNNVIQEVNLHNNNVLNNFNSIVLNKKKDFKSEILPLFESKISEMRSQLLNYEKEFFSYKTDNLGEFEYQIEKLVFVNYIFNEILDGVWKEQYKYNSLRTGSMPYSNCFGSDNYCSKSLCSEIIVKTDGNADVLVSVKNSNGKVVRHAYIKKWDLFTFNLPNGEYQVFFYSGLGWNPNKVIYSNLCNNLTGGFISDENVTKDRNIYLFNNKITYELKLQQGGNLQVMQSSKNEAF
jgi:hypothetical protein